MKLEIQVSGGEQHRIPALERAWAEFEATVAVPFAYDQPPTFTVCSDTVVSYSAEAAVVSGIATIRVTPSLLDGPSIERTLTLLHESLHIASFVGPLRHMYEAAVRFDPFYTNELHDRLFERCVQGDSLIIDRVNPLMAIGRSLAQLLFEVDAELALNTRFPQFASERTAYYCRMLEDSLAEYPYIGRAEIARPYTVMYDRLRSEIAGVLDGADSLTARLNARIASTPGFVEPDDTVLPLQPLLSPNANDFTSLPSWGISRYEQVFRRVTEAAFLVS